jgi:hypothetical protein
MKMILAFLEARGNSMKCQEAICPELLIINIIMVKAFYHAGNYYDLIKTISKILQNGLK